MIYFIKRSKSQAVFLKIIIAAVHVILKVGVMRDTITLVLLGLTIHTSATIHEEIWSSQLTAL